MLNVAAGEHPGPTVRTTIESVLRAVLSPELRPVQVGLVNRRARHHRARRRASAAQPSRRDPRLERLRRRPHPRRPHPPSVNVLRYDAARRRCRIERWDCTVGLGAAAQVEFEPRIATELRLRPG